MSLVMISPTTSDPTSCDHEDDLVIQEGVEFVGGDIAVRRLLTPEGCTSVFGTLDAQAADFYDDVVVQNAAHIGTMTAHKNVRFERGVKFDGPVHVLGDLTVVGGEMVTDHVVIVVGKARFDYRPSGRGIIYCDDSGPADG